MSRKKHNIAYIKPQEPAFLTRLKQQAGYKEGPSIDTKREDLPTLNSSDESEGEEQPQVVVLKPGDLTKEEAERAEKEAAEAPADLNQRVLFKKPEKTSGGGGDASGGQPDGRSSAKKRPSVEGQSGQKKKKQQKPLLSFDDEEEEGED